MTDQAQQWSKAAADYEVEFIDPYLPGVRNPLPAALAELADPQQGTAADLGCGVGPLLPTLAKHFRRVIAVDFAEGMLKRARENCDGIIEHRVCPSKPYRLDAADRTAGCRRGRQQSRVAGRGRIGSGFAHRSIRP